MKVIKYNSQGVHVQEVQHKRQTIGIDLGTTYSCVGVWEDDGVKIIGNSKGSATTPSCVSFTKGERFVVGDSAKSRIGSNPTTTIYGAKRLIGRKFSDESVQSCIKQWPFKVVASNDGNDKPMIAVTHNGEDKQFSAEEISAMVLKKMKETAESYLGSKVTSAVITVPAHFNVPQRQATMAAAEVAGLKVNRLINEPVAAAVAYTFTQSQSQSQSRKSSKGGVGNNNILVFDFGGGTLDVSVIRVWGSTFEVVAMDGDKDLGGDEINTRMVSHFVGVFKRKHGKDIGNNARAMARLWAACERAKRVLSRSFVTTIDIECLFETTDFFTIVTRRFLEKLCADLFVRSVDCATTCVKLKGRMQLSDVNSVILAGGTSKIPKIQHMLEDTFKGSKIFKNIISPDEVVAYGATIISEMKDVEFSDYTTSSVGIEVYGAKMSVIIPNNTVLPTKNSRVYTTVDDNQKAVRFSVFQGEHHDIEKNEYLNGFTLKGIPPAPAREPRFDVTMTINKEGVLTMSSELRGTTNRKEISIDTTLTSQSTRQMIELRRMVDDSKKNKSKETFNISNIVKKKNKFKHCIKMYATITLECVRKQMKQISYLNCFNIRD